MYGLSLLYGPNKICFSLKKCMNCACCTHSASGDALQRWSCCGGRHRFGAKLPAKRKRNVEPALAIGPSKNAMAKAMAGCTKCHAIQKQNAIHGKNMNISWTMTSSIIINYHHHCRKSELVLFLFMIFYIRLAMILQELAANKEITTAGGHGCYIPTSQVRREVILGTSGSARIKSRIKALLTGNWMLLVLFFRSISLW